MTSPYEAGTRFEHDVIHHLQTDGYETIRAAGSHGKADIIAFKHGQTLIIQCKKNGIISPNERNEVIRLAGILRAIPIVAFKQARHKKPLYDRLTGPGPKDRQAFTTDEIIEPWRP